MKCKDFIGLRCLVLINEWGDYDDENTADCEIADAWINVAYEPWGGDATLMFSFTEKSWDNLPDQVASDISLNGIAACFVKILKNPNE